MRIEDLPTTDFGRSLRHPKRTYPGVPAAPVVVNLAAKNGVGLDVRFVRTTTNWLDVGTPWHRLTLVHLAGVKLHD